MTIFECAKCGYSTQHKSWMNRHLLKKLPCKQQKVVVNWPIMQEVNKYGTQILKLEADIQDKEFFEIN